MVVNDKNVLIPNKETEPTVIKFRGILIFNGCNIILKLYINKKT